MCPIPKRKKKKIANVMGSKDGRTWEEVIREEQSSKYNRFSHQQSLRNLTLLMKWCEDKIIELTEKKIRDEKDAQD